MSEPLQIFEATYDTETKKIALKVNTGHIPMLCYAVKLLELEVTDKILEAQVPKSNGIVLPKMGIEI